MSPAPQTTPLLLPRCYVRAPVASESFSRHDLVIHRSQIHSMASPGVDVVRKGDGVIAALASVGRTDAPELRERSVPQNVWAAFVDLIDVVGATIAVYRAQGLGSVTWGCKRAVAIHHVILDQGVGGP